MNLHATAEVLDCARRARVMDQLTNDGIQLALPLSDGDIDMFAYAARGAAFGTVAAVPIKVESFGFDAFASHLATLKPSGLLVVVICETGTPQRIGTFAFTPAELLLLKMVGAIERNTAISSQRPPANRALGKALESYAMCAGKWREKIRMVLAEQSMN